MADTTETPDDEDAPESQKAEETAAGEFSEKAPEDSAPLITPPPAGGEDHTASGEEGEEGEAPKKRSGLVRGLLVAAGIVIAGQAIILVSTGGWRDVLSPTSAEDKARLTTLEAKLAALEAADVEAAARDQSFADDMEARGSEIDALTNTIGEISASPANDLATTQAMISALEERLDSFEVETGEVDPMLGADTNPGQQVQGAGSAEVSEMKDALASLSERFASMNENLEAAGGRIEALEETAPPENLEEILGSMRGAIRPQSEIDALSARLAAIEEADPEGAARAAILALSATELARAVATSRSFTSELEGFLVLAPDNTFASSLRPFALEGAPMTKTLLLEFDAAARAIVEAERIRKGGGWWNWLMNKITGLYSIRKVGEVNGNDWQAILARAEERVAIEDLGAATSEVSNLTGAAAEGAAPWLARARARAAVDSLVTQLTTAIFADLITALEGE